jgi:hypothetical protein
MRAVAASDLPALEHLDVWLGVDDGHGEVADEFDLEPFCAGTGCLYCAPTVGMENSAVHGQPLTHLRRLDLHHHYLSEHMMERLRAAFPKTEVDLGDAGGDYHGPFVEEVYNFVADGRDF